MKPFTLPITCGILLVAAAAQAQTIPAPASVTAAAVAAQTTILAKPLRDTPRLALPAAPEGFRWTIESTAPAGIIAPDGTITRPPAATTVAVSLRVQNLATPADAARVTLGVPVDPPYTPPAMSAGRVRELRDHYERQKLGLFVHYVPSLTIDTHGTRPSIDTLAADLDVTQFARDAADFGAEYVIFTVMHLKARPLYPSAVNQRWRDDRRAGSATGKAPDNRSYAATDLIDRLATALAAKGIDLHLYVHPVDGHDFTSEDRKLTGWDDCSNNHETWNTFQNELYDELGRRYGERIKGLWFDGMFIHTNHKKSPRHEAIQQDRLRATLLAYNPGLALVGNVSSERVKNPYPAWTGVDYRAWECARVTDKGLGFAKINPAVKEHDARTWPGTKEQVAMIVGGNWWASDKRAAAKQSPEDLFLYLVLQAAVSNSGGLAIAAGCFPGTAAANTNGNIWEGNFRETMLALNSHVSPIAESISNTRAGRAYVTPDHAWLDQTEWGVSTESADGKTIYLHVIKPPAGRTLTLGPAADGSQLGGPAMILPSGIAVEFKQEGSAYQITLPAGAGWSPLDTVIKVRRL